MIDKTRALMSRKQRSLLVFSLVLRTTRLFFVALGIILKRQKRNIDMLIVQFSCGKKKMQFLIALLNESCAHVGDFYQPCFDQITNLHRTLRCVRSAQVACWCSVRLCRSRLYLNIVTCRQMAVPAATNQHMCGHKSILFALALQVSSDVICSRFLA